MWHKELIKTPSRVFLRRMKVEKNHLNSWISTSSVLNDSNKTLGQFSVFALQLMSTITIDDIFLR